MPRRAAVVLWLVALFGVFSAQNVLAKVDVRLDGRDLVIYDSLSEPRFDTNACYTVKPNSVWRTELGAYEFVSGRLCFFTSVAGVPTGCWFRGHGRLTFRPPSSIEREQLRRFCGDTVLNAQFDELYLRFFDPGRANQLKTCTAERLPSSLHPDDVPAHFARDVERDLSLDLPARGWELIRNGDTSGVFLYVRPMLGGQRPLHFVLDETAEEAITLWRRPGGVSGVGMVDLVCSYDYPRHGDDSLRHAAILNEGIDIQNYKSMVDIEGSGDMRLDVTLTCTSHRGTLRVLTFSMAPDLKIDTVWVGGTIRDFVYSEDGGWLMAGGDTALGPGDSLTVRMQYHGNRLLDKFSWGDFAIHHTTRWLPMTTPRRRATYQTTFRCPKYYEVVSVGEKIADTIVADRRQSEWRTIGTVSFISFNYGSFEKLTTNMTDGPRVDIYRGKNHLGGLLSRDFKKRVADEIEAAIRLFSQYYGPYPWPHLAVTEIPDEHGQGFPQLLHLAWISFDTEVKGVTDVFRAHEVAHQWFGHIVGWKSYHDQWLSEGFAEYAGAVFLQARHPGNREFVRLLDEWRELIIEKGGHESWHEGPGVAPIWLGYRAASFMSPASYSHLIYAKGAYILHMLRQQIYDYDRGSDDRFIAMMRDYITTFAGRNPTTDDFRRIVEKHLGMPMQWFFDQWVYGTQIPRFEYHWTKEQRTDGQWLVRGRIDQREPNPPFRVFMPITLEFAEGHRTFVQEIKETHTEFVTPPLEAEPRGVRFDDYRSILCNERIVEHP